MCHPTFCRGYDSDEDEEDLLDDVIDGGMKDAEGDDLDDRAARFLLYWTTITKVCWQYGVEYHHYDKIIPQKRCRCQQKFDCCISQIKSYRCIVMINV